MNDMIKKIAQIQEQFKPLFEIQEQFKPILEINKQIPQVPDSIQEFIEKCNEIFPDNIKQLYKLTENPSIKQIFKHSNVLDELLHKHYTVKNIYESITYEDIEYAKNELNKDEELNITEKQELNDILDKLNQKKEPNISSKGINVSLKSIRNLLILLRILLDTFNLFQEGSINADIAQNLIKQQAEEVQNQIIGDPTINYHNTVNNYYNCQDNNKK